MPRGHISPEQIQKNHVDIYRGNRQPILERPSRGFRGTYEMNIAHEVAKETGDLFKKVLKEYGEEGAMTMYGGKRGSIKNMHSARIAVLEAGDKKLILESKIVPELARVSSQPIRARLKMGDQELSFLHESSVYNAETDEQTDRIGLLRGATLSPESQESMQQDFATFMQEATAIIEAQQPLAHQPADIGRIALS